MKKGCGTKRDGRQTPVMVAQCTGGYELGFGWVVELIWRPNLVGEHSAQTEKACVQSARTLYVANSISGMTSPFVLLLL